MEQGQAHKQQRTDERHPYPHAAKKKKPIGAMCCARPEIRAQLQTSVGQPDNVAPRSPDPVSHPSQRVLSPGSESAVSESTRDSDGFSDLSSVNSDPHTVAQTTSRPLGGGEHGDVQQRYDPRGSGKDAAALPPGWEPTVPQSTDQVYDVNTGEATHKWPAVGAQQSSNAGRETAADRSRATALPSGAFAGCDVFFNDAVGPCAGCLTPSHASASAGAPQ